MILSTLLDTLYSVLVVLMFAVKNGFCKPIRPNLGADSAHTDQVGYQQGD